MNPQIERDMRRIDLTFLAMLVCGCVLGVAAFWGLEVAVRHLIARVIQGL